MQRIEPEYPQRTNQQNNAIHLYFELVAKALNDAEHYLVVTVGSKVTKRLWTKELVKEHIWRPIQRAEFKTTSTTELKTIDPGIVYDYMNAFISGEFGIYVPFPDRFSAADAQTHTA